MRKQGMAIVSVVALALAVAACGSSSKKTSSSASSSPPPASTPSKGVKVVLRKVSFGTVLVGPNSHTVYLFMKDKGTTSQCNGKCATVWTPLTSSGGTYRFLHTCSQSGIAKLNASPSFATCLSA